jgi:tetratricopeptide (TPR) repeat protein
MYRQDLSSIIRPLGVVLFLFVAFQVWIKPTDFDRRPPEPSEPLAPQPAISRHTLPLVQDAPGDALQPRLIQPGEAPSAQLENIRDDVDRGNYRDAEANLHKLPDTLLAKDRARQFAAALWNNLGVQQEQHSGIEVSVKAFEQAVALAPKNPVALLNLTHAYWGLHDKALTPAFLESVLRAAPNDAFSHIALADLQIEHGKLAEAARHMKYAQARAVTDPDLKAYFQRLTGKLDRQMVAGQSDPASVPAQPVTTPSPLVVPPKTESPLSPSIAQESATAPVASTPSGETAGGPVTPHVMERFAITFNGKPDPETALRIRSILDYAYEEMSKKFGYAPTASIQVVLHTAQKFAPDAGSPIGADKLYDQDSSTIHLPVDGAMEDLAILSRILRHQFAHALLQDKMRTRKDHIPSWLVEGLAIQLAEDPWPALEEIKQKPPTIIALALLEKGWDRSQTDKLGLSYVESTAAVQSLVDRYGMYGIRQIMNLIQAGQSFDAAMKQKWSVSYVQFQRDWEKNFTSSMGQK